MIKRLLCTVKNVFLINVQCCYIEITGIKQIARIAHYDNRFSQLLHLALDC